MEVGTLFLQNQRNLEVLPSVHGIDLRDMFSADIAVDHAVQTHGGIVQKTHPAFRIGDDNAFI